MTGIVASFSSVGSRSHDPYLTAADDLLRSPRRSGMIIDLPRGRWPRVNGAHSTIQRKEQGIVRLYGADLFTRAAKQSVVRHLNNAPGGDDGVDPDVQYRLGADGAPAMLDRRHGICCGITLAWIVGFCHKRDEAVNTTNFSNYFRDVLRFEGAYMKDNKGTVGSIDDLDGIYPHGLMRASNGKCRVSELTGKFPTGTWAAYIGAWHHAIGIGSYDRGTFRTDRYYIMDPNAGLFKYDNVASFREDVKQIFNARRIAKGEDETARLSYTFFKKV